MRVSSQVQPIATPIARGVAGAGVGPSFASIVSNGVLADYVTFTRSSTATRYNSAGLLEQVPANAPRYDYDPTTVTRANLLRYSNFDQPASTLSMYGLASVVDVPGFGKGIAFGHDGVTPSYTYPSWAGTSLSIGETVTFSVHVLMHDGLPPSFTSATVSNVGNTFALVINGGLPSPLSYSVETIGGGVYRVSAALAVTSVSGNTGVSKYAGNDARTFTVFGAQLERGSTATAYIPTGVLTRGPNVVVDDGFDDPAYWTTAGAATVSGSAANLSGVSQVFRDGSALVAGRAYEAEIMVSAITGGVVAVRTNSTNRGTTAVAGVFRVPFVATVTGERIEVAGNASAAASVDYLRIREINYDYNSPRGDAALRGLLVEEQRTNYMIRSREFNDAAWNKQNITIGVNAAVAPDGTLTADKIIEDATNTVHRLSLVPATVSPQNMVASVYAKAGERNRISIGVGNARYSGANVRLTDGEVSGYFGIESANVTVTATNVGDGWWRVVIRAAFSVADTANVWIGSADNSGNLTYLGDGVSGLFVWGAQAEVGSFPTSYIPTTAAALTRSADSCNAPPTSFGYNAAGWTIFSEFSSFRTPNATSTSVWDLGDGTTLNRVLHYLPGSIRTLVAPGAVTVDGPLHVPGVVYQTAVATDGVLFTSVVDGAAPASVAAAIPVVTNLGIGSAPYSSSIRINGHIRRLRYYPRRLPDAQLQALTA